MENPIYTWRRRTWAIVAGSATTVVVISGLCLWGASAGGWEGGNTVGTWLQAVGTLGAFTAALALYAREAGRDQERQVAALRAQAEKVAAWYGSEERPVDSGAGAPIGPGPIWETSWHLWMRNASDLPVFAVRPRVYDRDGRELQVHETVNQLGSQSVQDSAQRDTGRGRPYIAYVRAMLPPRSTVALVVDAQENRSVQPTVDLEFRDNAGRWWESVGGVLRQVDPPA